VTGLPPEWSLIPKIYPSEEDERLASDHWQRMALPPGKPVVACFMTTRGASRVWPRDYYAEALRLIHRDSGACIVLSGSKQDAPVLQEFVSRCPTTCRLMAGDLSLRPLYCFLRKCSAVLAPDSGSRHLANAAGTPVVFIRNLFCSKAEAGKYCGNEIDISPDAELIPVGRQDAVLRRVSPALLAQTVLSVLRRE
jgi:ADP-heptose:LPS heptosyltransferase